MSDFEKSIGYTFSSKDLLLTALTHRSYSNENIGAEHNERLEFLGDAVLQFLSTEYLYTKYPDKTEGDMSILRSALVDTNALFEAGESLGIQSSMRFSVGQEKEMQSRASKSVIANAVEAIVGAIFLDGGLENSRKFAGKHIFSKDILPKNNESLKDSKTLFQEMSQKWQGNSPTYILKKTEGPDHDKMFHVVAQLGDEVVSEGMGKTKQMAEQDAAKKGLNKKGWNE